MPFENQSNIGTTTFNESFEYVNTDLNKSIKDRLIAMYQQWEKGQNTAKLSFSQIRRLLADTIYPITHDEKNAKAIKAQDRDGIRAMQNQITNKINTLNQKIEQSLSEAQNALWSQTALSQATKGSKEIPEFMKAPLDSRNPNKSTDQTTQDAKEDIKEGVLRDIVTPPIPLSTGSTIFTLPKIKGVLAAIQEEKMISEKSIAKLNEEIKELEASTSKYVPPSFIQKIAQMLPTEIWKKLRLDELHHNQDVNNLSAKKKEKGGIEKQIALLNTDQRKLELAQENLKSAVALETSRRLAKLPS